MKSRFSLHSGFSLVEVVLALGIFSFAIVAIIGLMGASMKVTRDNEEQISAANVATIIAGRYRELLQAEKDGASPDWDEFPLDRYDQIPGEPASKFESGGLVDAQGRKVSDIDEAAFGLGYLVSKEPIGSSGADLVTCSLQLRWPVVAAQKDKPDEAPVNSYTMTTAFVITP